MSRELIEKIALTWIGTPYHHHSGIKGVGCDCVHLLIKVYVEAGLMEDYDPGYYPPQFFMHSDEERFLKKVLGYSREIPEAEAGVGDVVLYKLGKCYAHGAIIVSPGWPHSIVHADASSNIVVRSRGLGGGLGKAVRAPRFFSRW